MDERSPWVLQRAEFACHCLLVETRDTFVLVDTGLGSRATWPIRAAGCRPSSSRCSRPSRRPDALVAEVGGRGVRAAPGARGRSAGIRA
jgi:hypothetical protein